MAVTSTYFLYVNSFNFTEVTRKRTCLRSESKIGIY